MKGAPAHPRVARGLAGKLLLAGLTSVAIGLAGAYLGGAASSWGHRIASSSATMKTKVMKAVTDKGRGVDQTGSIDQSGRNSDGYVEELERILDSEHAPAVDRGKPEPQPRR